jgi:alpha-tubulin suppressor-like RCC1 family protein
MKKLLIFVIVIALLAPLAGCEQIVNAEISKVSEIAAGVTHSMAVKKDGSLWTCSDNDFGQLGLATDNRIPSQVKK